MPPVESPPSSRTKVPLRVDRIACTGHGVCAALLPGDVQRDEWGYPIVVNDLVDAQAAGEAIRLCPARALYLAPGR